MIINILQVDASMLDPSCLVPPTIPNTLGAEDIDKVKLDIGKVS